MLWSEGGSSGTDLVVAVSSGTTGAATLLLVVATWWVFFRSGPRVKMSCQFDDQNSIHIRVVNKGRIPAEITHVGLATRGRPRLLKILRRSKDVYHLSSYPDGMANGLWQALDRPLSIPGPGSETFATTWPVENCLILASRETFWPKVRRGRTARVRPKKIYRVAHFPNWGNIRAVVMFHDGYKSCKVKYQRGAFAQRGHTIGDIGGEE